MNELAKLLPAQNVFVEVDARSQKRLFEVAAELLEQSSKVSRRVIFDSLLARERLGSTALGHGIALPHGRVKNLREATGVFLRLSTPISFDAAPDDLPVRFVFFLLVPEHAPEHHLQILSELVQLFGEAAFRTRLEQAGAADIHLAFTAGQDA